MLNLLIGFGSVFLVMLVCFGISLLIPHPEDEDVPKYKIDARIREEILQSGSLPDEIAVSREEYCYLYFRALLDFIPSSGGDEVKGHYRGIKVVCD